MALFSKKQEKSADAPTDAPKNESVKKSASPSRAQVTDRNLSSVLIKPRITEKAVSQGDKNVYTFLVRRDASKHDVRDAIKQAFNVTPVRVNIVNKAPRTITSRASARTISQKGIKKAYVYLNQGDRIDLV